MRSVGAADRAMRPGGARAAARCCAPLPTLRLRAHRRPQRPPRLAAAKDGSSGGDAGAQDKQQQDKQQQDAQPRERQPQGGPSMGASPAASLDLPFESALQTPLGYTQLQPPPRKPGNKALVGRSEARGPPRGPRGGWRRPGKGAVAAARPPALAVPPARFAAPSPSPPPSATPAVKRRRAAAQGGLRRAPLSGGVKTATERYDLPAPHVAVRNLVEQARFSHLCTVMSHMHHRRGRAPRGAPGRGGG
jgi:hypothetical protein